MVSSYDVLQQFFTDSELQHFIETYSDVIGITEGKVEEHLRNRESSDDDIDQAFSWSQSEDGHEFWSDINERFKEEHWDIYKSFNGLDIMDLDV